MDRHNPMRATRPVTAVYVLMITLTLLLVCALWQHKGRPHPLPEITSASHKLQCVSYSPFDKDQSPLEPDFDIRPARIDADLALLAKYFTCVRTYSTTGLEQLPEFARKHGLKLMLGAWVSADSAATQQEIDLLVAMANANTDVVTSVIVGNEALLRKDIAGTRLAELITEVKARVRQPVTYADVWEFWELHPQIAPVVDFITIHLLPYWENDPAGIDQALAHVAKVREDFAGKFPGKPILIGETGWPSEGRQRETALPSRLNQARFMRGFVQLAERRGWDYNLIEAFDQPWKRVNEGAVGGYWGLFDADRNDKNILSGPISNLPQWQRWLALSIAVQLTVLLCCGMPVTVRRALVVPGVAAAAGVGIALWWLQAVNDNRDLWEWSWTCALTVLNAGALLRFGVQAAAGDAGSWRDSLRRVIEPKAGALLLCCAFVAAVLMLQLVFDSRYREFPWYVLLPMALALLAEPVTDVPVPETRLLLAVIVLGIPLQLWQETLFNAQALGWAVVSALLSFVLWRSSRTSRSNASSNANTASVTV